MIRMTENEDDYLFSEDKMNKSKRFATIAVCIIGSVLLMLGMLGSFSASAQTLTDRDTAKQDMCDKNKAPVQRFA